MKKSIIILGSTGSIGKTFIKILEKDVKNIDIKLVSINKNYKELLKQVKFFNIKNILVKDKKIFILIKKILRNKKINIYNNADSIEKIFTKKVDFCINAISGLEGLEPTLKIIKYTNRIAIANKESIICGWNLIINELKKNKTEFVPIDSEHFSIWSLINKKETSNIEKIFITASGGPFLNYPLNKFKNIKIKDALKHPNWSMGKKITIDSATMMNKVFEIIEAKKIFDLQYRDIEILIHPKSYIHAIVKFKNGLTKILLHDTTMTIPIFNSLYSNTKETINTKKIDLKILNNLELTKVDLQRYPSVKVLKKLPKTDSFFEILIVIANDKLVDLFLKKKIKFNEISSKLHEIIESPEFKKYKLIKPKNISDIKKIKDYLSLKINYLSV